jgi:3-hydroxy-9,10-secoandrosta-1,3,5(10)-triene-9,17-dione monooxygenase reductase component
VTRKSSDSQELHRPRPVEARTLRSVCGLFVTGVTVITSGRGKDAAGKTVNSFTSVSLDPSLVLFCLHNQSRMRGVIEESGAYAVNILAAQQEPLAWAFAGRETADIRDVPHRPSVTGVPVLSDVIAFLSCQLVASFESGDHTVFVGEVVELGAAPRNAEPLVFFRGVMGSLK